MWRRTASKRRFDQLLERLRALMLLSIGAATVWILAVSAPHADAWTGQLVDEMYSELLPLQVVGHRGRIVWDYPVDGNAVSGIIEKTRFNNKTHELKIPDIYDDSGSDLGLGTGPKGHTVAVYHGGCKPLGGCGLYLYDFVTREARQLQLSKSNDHSYQSPSVSGNRVIYGFNSSRVAWSYINSARVNEIKWLKSSIDDMVGDFRLKGSRLVFMRVRTTGDRNDLPRRYGMVDTMKQKFEIYATKLSSKKKRIKRLATANLTIKTRPQDLDYAKLSGTTLTSPSLAGNSVYYGRVRYGKHYGVGQQATTSRIEKVSIRGGKRTLSSYKSGQIVSVAKANRNVFYMRNDFSCDKKCPYPPIKGSLFQASDDLFAN